MPNPTGADVAALFDPRSEAAITNQERVIMAALMVGDDRVELHVPADMSTPDLWRTLDLCARVHCIVVRASLQLKMIIGRAINLIQARPEIYTSRGFESFNEFMSRPDGLQALTGISRGELFKLKALDLALGPTVRLEDVRELGITKIALIAGATKAGSTAQRELIEAARGDTTMELRERIAMAGLAGSAADLEMAILTMAMTVTQKNTAEAFFADPLVQAYCGTASAGLILDRAIAECRAEWQVQALAAEGEMRDG